MCLKRKDIEYYYPVVLSTVIVIVVFLYISKVALFKSVIDKLLLDNTLSLIISIESTLFGFQLAVLALILQMNNKLIEAIKEFGRYKDLIHFSKCSVYSTLSVVILSIIIYLIKDLPTISVVGTAINYVWGFALTYSILSTYRFVKVFYVLANSN